MRPRTTSRAGCTTSERQRIVKIQCIPIASDDGLGGVETSRDISGAGDIRMVSPNVLCAWKSDRRSAGSYVVFSSIELHISAPDLSHHYTLRHHMFKIVRTGNRTLLMTFFVTERERLEASTYERLVSGWFQTSLSLVPELGVTVSDVPNPAAEI
jgi:hypothetical protein